MSKEKNLLITENEISAKLKEALRDEINLDIAVAFWGDGNPLIDVFKTKNTRIICNLESGGTNPKIIEDLIKHGNEVQVKQNSKLHAKTYLGDGFVIIGSSNVSTNGMVNEGSEIVGWHEANVYSSERNLVNQAAKWFNKIWSDHSETRMISQADLREAKIKWENKRKSRVILQEDNIFQNPDLVKDKNIRITSDRYEQISNNANREYKKIKEERNYSTNYGAYESPKQWKPKPGSIILDFEKTDNKIIYRGCVEIEHKQPITPLNKSYNLVIYKNLKNCPDLNKAQIKQINHKMIELYKRDMCPYDISLYNFIKKYMYKNTSA